MEEIESLQWIANYYHRQNSISREKLRRLESMGITPKFKDRKVERIKLTSGRLDWESIYGSLDELIAED